MSSNHNDKMTDAKKMTLVFRRTAEFELEFSEWYENKKDEFKSEADAVVQWEAMCDNCDEPVELDDDNDFGWDEVADEADDIMENYRTDAYDEEMMKVIDDAEEAFEALGVKFYKDHSCCNTCGHAEAEDENYVFYHAQDTDRLRRGDRSVHLAFHFDDEHKAKVLEMIEKQTCDAIRLHWAGEDHTKIFLTCDDDEMAAHIKEDAERQVRMKELSEKKKSEEEKKQKEKEARRLALLKELAELDA